MTNDIKERFEHASDFDVFTAMIAYIIFAGVAYLSLVVVGAMS